MSGPSFVRVVGKLEAAGFELGLGGGLSGDAWFHCLCGAHAHGDRNPSLKVSHDGKQTLIHCFAGGAASTDEILSLARLDWPELFDDYQEPTYRRKVRPTARTAAALGLKPEADASPVLRALDTHRMLTTDPPPLEWLVDGVFARGHHTLFGGREKRGKSLVQLIFAVCMASGGGEVAGITVEPGRVLIIDAENGERMIWRRLRQVVLGEAFADNLTVHEARGFELRRDLGLVTELAGACRADLVLLDSFRALWSGNERDEGEVTEALQPVTDLAHDLDIAIGTTHHQQKSGDEYRGSSAIGACPDWIVRLDRMDDDPKKKSRRRLVNTEARIDMERDDRWIEVCAQGPDGPITLAAAEPYEPERHAPARDQVVAELRAWVCQVCQLYIGDGTVAHPGWSKAELADAIGRNHRSGTFRRALQHLADLGVIHRNGDERWYPSPTLFDSDLAEEDE
jgi:hypothetical protein